MATKTTSSGQKFVDWVKGHKVICAVIVIVVLLLGIGASSLNQKQDNTKGKDSAQDSQETTISEEKAEEYCQDAALLEKYIDLKKYSVISIANYDKQYGAFGGWYDTDGKDILYLRWNGKNKLTDQLAHFDCWISGTDDNISLHKLVIEDETVFDITKSSVVDKEGARVFDGDTQE